MKDCQFGVSPVNYCPGGRLHVSCVTMREQKKTMRKAFFRAGHCAALLTFRVGKNAIFIVKGLFFYNFTKGCRSKRVGVLIYYIGKGYSLTGHSEKRYQFQNVGHTV